MFHSLQCVQKGCVPMPSGGGGSTAVFADDCGGLWVVTADAQSVLYYAPHALEACMSHATAAAAAAFPPLFPGSSGAASAAAPPPPAHTVAFSCAASPSSTAAAAEQEEGDAVHSVLFFHGGAAGSASSHRRDVCVVTAKGTLAFLRVPPGHEERPPLLQPYQEVSLELRVTATTTTPGAVILCCCDGQFTEVVRALVAPASDAGTMCAHLSDAAVADAVCTCDVEAVGLFRVQGRVDVVLYDAARSALVALSAAGNVDVWDVDAGADVTAQFGAPSWDVGALGSATCAAVCRDRLWVGLSSGQLLLFSLALHPLRGGATPRAVPTVLRSHHSPISSLITMSMQSSIWSCAADNGKVNVWDAATAAFRGSFVFPRGGVQSCASGASLVRTALWGVDAEAALPCLLQVTESVSRRDALAVCRDDVQRRHTEEVLLHSYRVCLKGLLQLYCDVQDGAAQQEEGRLELDPVAVDCVAGDLAASLRTASAAAAALYGLQDTMESLRPLAVAPDSHLAGGGEGDSDGERELSSQLQRLITERHRLVHTEREFAALCYFVSQRCSDRPAVHSVEDLREEFEWLHTRTSDLEAALNAQAKEREAAEALEQRVDEATAQLSSEVAALRDALDAAQQRCQALEAELREVREEAAADHERHQQLERLLEERDAQLAEATRALLATKRAAEVTATEVSSLFDMESRLHASQTTIAELSAKVESLVGEVQGRDEQLGAYRQKEAAAREVLRHVLQAQRSIADGVGAFVDAVEDAVEDAVGLVGAEGRGDRLPAPVRQLIDSVQREASTLETDVDEKLRQQKAWFQTLSHELRSGVLGQERHPALEKA